MKLVADRFVVSNDAAIDLSTGDRVELIISAQGGASEHVRWSIRCARFTALHQRTIAPLVDYGPMCEGRRFEAWRCDGPWRGTHQQAAEAIAGASEFLAANGWSLGSLESRSVRELEGRAIVIPGHSTGFEEDRARVGAARRHVRRQCLGVATIAQEALGAIVEIFREEGEPKGRSIVLTGPRGVGLDVAMAELARSARLHGYIPIGSRTLAALGAQADSLLAGRSALLLVPAWELEGWRALIRLSLISHRAHLAIFSGEIQASRLSTVRLERQSPERLCLSVLPRERAPAMHRAIATAAKRANGLPRRFVELLWGQQAMREPVNRPPSVLCAAERAPAYGDPTVTAMPLGAEVPHPEWPAATDLAALRHRLTQGMAELASGRHVAGSRAVRQAGAFLARRHDWAHATRAGIALAESLLKRGNVRDARNILDDTRKWGERAGDDRLMLQIAVLSGIALTDDGRLDEAEAVLSATVSSAQGLKEHAAIRSASFALARCLFWKGRYTAGEHSLSDLEPTTFDDTDRIRLEILRSRLAVGGSDLRRGVMEARSALARAQTIGRQDAVARAACAAAFAHLAIGDSPAVTADVSIATHAARRAHNPLQSVRARLLEAENQRRHGRRALASALCARIARMKSRALPATVRARANLLLDLLAGRRGEDVASRRAQTSGLPALTLFAPPAASGSPIPSAASDIISILRCCQTAEEDSRVLALMCTDLRRRLRAASVAVFVEDREAFVPVATDGVRIDAAAAARVAALDDALAPHQLNGVSEGGAPVRYGGRLVGVLAARWSPGTTDESGNATLLLTTAAAASGPALASLRGQRMSTPGGPRSDLLGTSAPIADVRRAVERAARAPFAVLVVGESGSGKELVARALHRQSSRRDRPFCTLNCAALPDELVESELFGHSRGAFTGAVAERPGVFEEAHTGTLFLDEIGELSPRAQAKVLRTIQEGELRRVGENTARRVDVRLVAATNRDLAHETQTGRFRLDLLYRLDVVRIVVPPLRDRREDVMVLAEHFWSEASARVGSRATLGLATLARLARYDWPGNVRELQNVLASLAVRSPRRGVVPPSALPPHFDRAPLNRSLRLDAARRTFETEFVRAALARAGGQRTQAAEELGITRQGLTKLMSRLGISDGARSAKVSATTID